MSMAITNFRILPCIVFSCPECGNQVKIVRHGPFHVSTGDHCRCGARITVSWEETNEQAEVIWSNPVSHPGACLCNECAAIRYAMTGEAD